MTPVLAPLDQIQTAMVFLMYTISILTTTVSLMPVNPVATIRMATASSMALPMLTVMVLMIRQALLLLYRRILMVMLHPIIWILIRTTMDSMTFLKPVE